MKNGLFTPEEREYLISLDAVESVTARSIVYSKSFKQDCMQRYHQGQSPSAIFARYGAIFCEIESLLCLMNVKIVNVIKTRISESRKFIQIVIGLFGCPLDCFLLGKIELFS